MYPECAITGYCFESLEEALPYGESVPGESVAAMAERCRRHGVSVVYGTLERAGDKLYNAAVCVGPDGFVAAYRKVHLPHLGVDFFTTPGDDPWKVYSVGDLNIGINICYDSAFPEAARVLALAGADLIVLPTNFPSGAECMLGHAIHTRAMENAVFYAAVNRVGIERGFRFLGRSKICDPDGRTLAEAPADEEAILLAHVDPGQHVTRRAYGCRISTTSIVLPIDDPSSTRASRREGIGSSRTCIDLRFSLQARWCWSRSRHCGCRHRPIQPTRSQRFSAPP